MQFIQTNLEPFGLRELTAAYNETMQLDWNAGTLAAAHYRDCSSRAQNKQHWACLSVTESEAQFQQLRRKCLLQLEAARVRYNATGIFLSKQQQRLMLAVRRVRQSIDDISSKDVRKRLAINNVVVASAAAAEMREKAPCTSAADMHGSRAVLDHYFDVVRRQGVSTLLEDDISPSDLGFCISVIDDRRQSRLEAACKAADLAFKAIWEAHRVLIDERALMRERRREARQEAPDTYLGFGFKAAPAGRYEEQACLYVTAQIALDIAVADAEGALIKLEDAIEYVPRSLKDIEDLSETASELIKNNYLYAALTAHDLQTKIEKARRATSNDETDGEALATLTQFFDTNTYPVSERLLLRYRRANPIG